MKMRKAGPVTLFVIGIIFTIAGGALTYFKTYPDYKLAKESTAWPQVEGVILSSEVTKRRVRRKKRRRTEYSPEISYSYEINGKKYQSSQIYIGSEARSSNNSRDAYKYINNYPVGKEVIVYYSKNEESNAILETGVKTTHYMFLGLSVVFAIVGLFILGTSLFKVAVFTTMAGVFLSSILGKKRKNNKDL